MRRSSPLLCPLHLSPKPRSRMKTRRKSTRPWKLLTQSRRAVRHTAAAAVVGGAGAVTKKNPPRSLRRPRHRPTTNQRRTRLISPARAAEGKARKLTARRRATPTAEAEHGVPYTGEMERELESASAEPEQPPKSEPVHPVETVTEKPTNPRRGWWQRLIQS